jgi:hypothetical protein
MFQLNLHGKFRGFRHVRLGSSRKAAPAALADFALGAIIEKDPDVLYHGRHDRFGPFGVHEHVFSPASPGQGPFFELLEHAPAEGLRLTRGLVEHATQWRRDQYVAPRRAFPRISIPFNMIGIRFSADSLSHGAALRIDDLFQPA